MKKLFILTVFACVFTFANAQKNMVVSAFSYTNNGQLDKALTAIEKASVHPDTKDWAKTWYYMGNVYYSIHMSTDEKYKNLDTNALQKAYDCYQKAIELDPKKEYYEQLMTVLYFCGQQFYNKGVELYNEFKYEEAMNSFDKTASINGIFDLSDSLATYNAALCAELSNKPAQAKEYYLKLIKINYHQPIIYSSLSSIYRNDKDTTKALEIIKKGRKIFPSNTDLIIAETNLYLASGKTQQAKDLLEILIQKDPTNQALYYAIGTNYDLIYNDTTVALIDRLSAFTEAEKNYKKAIELKKDYFDATYNLGALFYNEGVRIFQEADKLTDMKKYGELQKQFEMMWDQAIPYLESALLLNDTDYNTLISLKQLYSRKNDLDKLKIINDKLSSIKK